MTCSLVCAGRFVTTSAAVGSGAAEPGQHRVDVDQCAAAVAGVDGCICLDVGRCLFCGNSAGNEGIAVIGIRRGKGTVCGADNAGCNGLTIAECVADGNNLFTDLYVIVIISQLFKTKTSIVH